MRILFLGNSLVFFNDLPGVLEQLMKAAGKEVYVQSVTKGSATISDFTDESTVVGQKALPLLQNERWDYVIIEPSRRITPFEATVREAELASAKKIREYALRAGGDVLLYSVWGNNNGKVHEFYAESPIRIERVATHPMERKAHTAFLQRTNAAFSVELGGVKIAEVGYAFENLICAHPEINPYHADHRHPCPEGTYLAACVIYETIFGESVKPIPFTLDLPASDILKEIADATVLGGRIPTLA